MILHSFFYLITISRTKFWVILHNFISDRVTLYQISKYLQKLFYFLFLRTCYIIIFFFHLYLYHNFILHVFWYNSFHDVDAMFTRIILTILQFIYIFHYIFDNVAYVTFLFLRYLHIPLPIITCIQLFFFYEVDAMLNWKIHTKL